MGADLQSPPATRPPANHRHRTALSLIAAVTGLLALVAGPPAGSPAQPLGSSRLPHGFQISPGLWSGGQPSGDDAFAELRRLGIRVVLSVDGTPPDLEAAHRHGLRYIHLPIGYDGIPSNRVVELSRVAAGATNGGIYVHCHHGSHRGPAAAAILAMASGIWNLEDAQGFLRQAGTSPDYPGLHRAVRDFHMPSTAELNRVGPFPEVAATSTEVAVMVELDARMDRLRSAIAREAASQAGSPGTGPAEDAVLLWEQLREWNRQPAVESKPAGYRDRLAAAEAAAHRLRDALTSENAGTRAAALQSLGQSCTACHREYRNP